MQYSFLILTLSLIAKIFFIIIYHPVFWHDEMILFNISKQGFDKIFDLILAERHPPLYYFLAKILPESEVDLARIMITVISYALIFLALKYIATKKIPHKKELDLGLSMFFTSQTFLLITSDLKRQALAFPLLLIFVLFIYKHTFKKLTNLRETLIINFLLSAIFWTDYITYFWAVVTFTFLIFIKKRHLFYKVAVAQIFLFAIYMLVFGKNQISTNSQALVWLGSFVSSASNDPFLSFLQHSGGRLLLPSLLVVILLLFFAIGWYIRLFLINRKLAFFIFLYTSILFTVALMAHLFIRARYSYFIFFIVSIGAAFGLIKLRASKLQLSLLLFMLFVVGGIGYMDNKFQINKTFRIINQQALSETQKGKVGFIANGQGIFQHVFARYYLKSENVIPIKGSTMSIFASSQWLSKEDIIPYEQKNLQEKLIDTIKSNNLHSIVYVYFDYADQKNQEYETIISQVCGFQKEERVIIGTWLKFYDCSILI